MHPATLALLASLSGGDTTSPDPATDPSAGDPPAPASQDLEQENRALIEALYDEIEALRRGEGDGTRWYERFTLGGYGEHHLNLPEGGDGDQSDIHRWVLYLGYRFTDWLTLHSETELEHAFVSDGDGEISIEQLYTEIDLSEDFHLRIGRILSPLGIVNKRHEPTTFRGVERPSVATAIIPTTWSLDAVGVAGTPTERFAYELYVTNGLDSSGFSGGTAIRGGRVKERPGVNNPAVTGRVDYRPLAETEDPPLDALRLGLSGWYGGGDNADQGVSDDELHTEVGIVSADFEASVSCLDLRGVWAWGEVRNASNVNETFGNDVGKGFYGWYLEAGVHVMPEEWKSGRLADSDAIVFARYEDFDAQRGTPGGAAQVLAADRQEWTFGIDFFPVSQFVMKADLQLFDDAATGDPENQLNFGVGWYL